MIVTVAKTKEDMLQAVFVRRKVLVRERKYSRYEDEPDQDDLTCTVYVAKEGSTVTGTARVRREGSILRIQRMAISKEHRGKGAGRKIIARILKDFKGKKFYLMSPKQTIPFYEKFGFKKTTKIQKGKHHTYYRLQNY